MTEHWRCRSRPLLLFDADAADRGRHTDVASKVPEAIFLLQFEAGTITHSSVKARRSVIMKWEGRGSGSTSAPLLPVVVGAILPPYVFAP